MRRALVLLALTAACTKAAPGADDHEAQRPDPGGERVRHTPEVHLTAPDGTVHVVEVEVVREEAELERGLMFRRHLDPDAGMLFLMGETRIHTFWMRNTYIPLDMIFIAPDLTVAGVAADAVPQSDELRSVDVPSRYVLEVNAGWARKRGIARGAKVDFVRVKGVDAPAR